MMARQIRMKLSDSPRPESPPTATRPVPRSTHKLTTFDALGARNFRVYWIGLVLYVLGQRAEYVTLAWLVWELTYDPLYLGYLGLAQGLPFVVLQLGGGVLADRLDRLRLLVVTQFWTALIMTLAFVLTVTGLARVEHLLILGALSSAFRAFDEPSRMALLPQLIERDQLPNAIALSTIPFTGARVIGPSVAGLLIAVFGAPIGFAFAAVGSFAALGLYGRIRVAGSAPPSADGHGLLRQFLEGLDFVRRNFLFASLIGLSIFNSIFGMSYVTLLPIFADVYFQAGSGGYGLLQGAHGLGAVVSTLILATVTHRLRRRGL
jgi:MFS family permease